MMRIEQEVVVRAPVRDAFLLAAHPERMPLWNDSVLESSVLGELEEGASVVQVAKVCGHRFETVFLVSHFEPFRRVTYSSVSGPMAIEGTMEFEEQGPDTSIRWSIRGDARGFLRIGERLLRSVGEQEMRRCLARLSDLLESQRTSASA